MPLRSGSIETVCALSKLPEAKHPSRVQVNMDEPDLTAAESMAIIEEDLESSLDKDA